jgi:hypothetical protein
MPSGHRVDQQHVAHGVRGDGEREVLDQAQVDRLEVQVVVAGVRARDLRADRREVVRRTPGRPARGLQEGEEAHLPAISGWSSSMSRKAWKPRTMFFDGSVRSTRRMSWQPSVVKVSASAGRAR